MSDINLLFHIEQGNRELEVCPIFCPFRKSKLRELLSEMEKKIILPETVFIFGGNGFKTPRCSAF